MRRLSIGLLLLSATLVLLGGCPLPPGPAPALDAPTPASPADRLEADETRDADQDAQSPPSTDSSAAALLADCDDDGRSDWEELIAGTDPCNPFDGPDIDGDGTPNADDEDVDGDGVPNEDDRDVDGDGVPNATDPDIDADGIANSNDADIDGDFLRNRWDLDMDGDGLLNVFDADADADGIDKDEEQRQADERGLDSDSGPADEEDEQAQDEEEEEVDNGPPTTGDPTNQERIKIFRAVRIGFLQPQDPVETLERRLRRADANASLRVVANGIIAMVEATLADHPPAAGEAQVTDAAQQDFDQRIAIIDRLDGIATASVATLVAATNRVADAARLLDVEITAIAETAFEVGRTDNTPELNTATDTAEELVAEAVAVGIPADEVPAAVRPAANAADELVGNNPLEVAWRIVTDLVDEFRDDGGESSFAVLTVVRMVEQTADLIDEPTVEQLRTSARNILNATENQGLADPGAVVRAVTRAGGDPTNGIEPAEAAAAAQLVESETASP